MKKRAFTLIELLVVIAIIAILAAILFPVFAQAKNAAKKTQSLSNVKQLGLAALMYNADHDDTYTMGSGGCWWQPLDGGWTYNILPYMKNMQMLLSPGDPKDKSFWIDWMRTTPEAVNISYASNGYMKWDGVGWGMYGVIGMDQANTQVRADGTTCSGWMSKGIAKEGDINKPAETIMFAERFNSYPVFGPSNFFTGVDWWDGVGTGGLVPDGTRNGTAYMVDAWDGDPAKVWQKDNRFGGMNADWAKKSVVVWTDGHASAVSPIATNPNPAAQPSKNLWDVARPDSP